MNTPTRDLISRIRCPSSQAVARIEENNAGSSEVNLQSIPGSDHARILANSLPSSVAADLRSNLREPSSTGFASLQGMKHHGSSTPPLPNLAIDSRGLDSALEATSHTLGEGPLTEISRDSATLVTAEEMGFVENLYLWLGQRLGTTVVSQWGFAPGTKSVANLWNELVSGESSLEDSRPPKRITHVVSVKIKDGKGHVLVEAYQEMSDGRRRDRNRPLSEKMRPGESVEEACLRGIFEELGDEFGARERVMMVSESYTREQQERESISYPGLPTLFVLHSVEAHIQQLPSVEFSTDEDEFDHAGSALNGDAQQRPLTVKRHFWRWVPESEFMKI